MDGIVTDREAAARFTPPKCVYFAGQPRVSLDVREWSEWMRCVRSGTFGRSCTASEFRFRRCRLEMLRRETPPPVYYGTATTWSQSAAEDATIDNLALISC